MVICIVANLLLGDYNESIYYKINIMDMGLIICCLYFLIIYSVCKVINNNSKYKGETNKWI